MQLVKIELPSWFLNEWIITILFYFSTVCLSRLLANKSTFFCLSPPLGMTRGGACVALLLAGHKKGRQTPPFMTNNYPNKLKIIR